MTFFTELEQIILKFIWNQNCQSNCKEKEQTRRHDSPRFQTILSIKSDSNQKGIILMQNIHMHQWNKLESQEINPHTYGQSLIKEVRLHNGKKTVCPASLFFFNPCNPSHPQLTALPQFPRLSTHILNLP